MALLKNKDERELAVLGQIERSIQRHEKRERLYKIIIAGLGVVAAAAFATGRYIKK